MSTSSFTLPPSFSSFPDIDPGSSKRSSSPAANESAHNHRTIDFGKRDRSGKRGHREKDKLSSKREKYIQSDVWHGSEPRATGGLLDNERLKANEDRLRVEQQAQERDRWVPRPLFYSDRKGDTLNLTYGRLHTSDVPKYRPVVRE